MSKQTTIQVPEAIRKGSVRVLIGANFGALTDIGALRNPVITSLAENQSIEFDNVDPLQKFVKGQRVQVTFDLAEINFTNIAVLDAGIINYTTTAGSIVSGAEQLVVAGDWAYNQFIKITNQNGDGTIIDVNSVVAATNGALVAETDYFLGQNEAGEYGIFIKDSVTVTTLNQNITIDYDYTPNASKNLTFNDSGTKTLKCMRLINTDENGDEFRIDIEDGTNFAPISMDFAGDEEDNVAILPVDFQGKIVEWVDEQNA
jgi:hypothetical protein